MLGLGLPVRPEGHLVERHGGAARRRRPDQPSAITPASARAPLLMPVPPSLCHGSHLDRGAPCSRLTQQSPYQGRYGRFAHDRPARSSLPRCQPRPPRRAFGSAGRITTGSCARNTAARAARSANPEGAAGAIGGGRSRRARSQPCRRAEQPHCQAGERCCSSIRLARRRADASDAADGRRRGSARVKLGADVPGERLAGRGEALPGRSAARPRRRASQQQFLLDQVAQEEAAVVAGTRAAACRAQRDGRADPRGPGSRPWPRRVETGRRPRQHPRRRQQRRRAAPASGCGGARSGPSASGWIRAR